VTVSVAIVEAPGVSGDLLEQLIRGDPQFTLIGRYEHPHELREAGVSAVDIVVMCTPDRSLPSFATQLIDDRVCRSVVALSTRGKDVHVRCGDGRELRLSQASPTELLDAMRQAIASNGGGPIAC
jgi:hypothetical protein